MKNTRHVKLWPSVKVKSAKKKKKANPEVTQMFEKANKAFKKAIINIFKKFKEHHNG